jgi:hypothetical protein
MTEMLFGRTVAEARASDTDRVIRVLDPVNAQVRFCRAPRYLTAATARRVAKIGYARRFGVEHSRLRTTVIA